VTRVLYFVSLVIIVCSENLNSRLLPRFHKRTMFSLKFMDFALFILIIMD
jgi:hypothetical protein